MPNTPKVPTEKELEEIEAMAGLGMKFEDIARIKGMCDDTLKKYAKDKLERGKAKAKAQVMQTAFKMATSGKVPAMTMFWLKTQAGWRENQLDHQDENQKFSGEVDSLLIEIIRQVLTGQLDPKVAQTIGSLSGTLLKATAQTEIEERISIMERIVKAEPQPQPTESLMDKAMDCQETEIEFISKETTPSMSVSRNRLKKIELSLTPKQAVLAWLEETKLFKTMQEEIIWLSEEQNLAQVHQRWKNVDDEIRRVMRGQSKETVNQAIRQARRDICFLLALHQVVNFHILEDDPFQKLEIAYLATQLHSYINEKLTSNAFTHAIEYLGTTPYPLDKEIAEAARGLIEHAVHSLCITDYQVSEWLENQEDIPIAYRKFNTAVQKLVKSNIIQDGKTVYLTTIPIMGFRYLPILEREWVDQVLVELAEWGALLKQKEYQAKRPDDDHPLAMDIFYPPNTKWNGKDVPQATDWLELCTIREEVRKNWNNYPGTIKIIEGRSYIRLDDYIQWDNRFYNGEFEIEEAVSIPSWNRWIDTCHGEAVLGGISVEKLDYWFDTTSYVVYERATDAINSQERRRSEIAAMRNRIVNRYEVGEDYEINRYSYGKACRHLPMDKESFKSKLLTWKAIISGLLISQSAILYSVKQIEKQYFNGHTLLYPEVTDSLQVRIKLLEGLVAVFNDCIAGWLEDKPSKATISLEKIQAEAMESASILVEQFFIKAKAHALDQMGDEERAKALYRQMLD